MCPPRRSSRGEAGKIWDSGVARLLQSSFLTQPAASIMQPSHLQPVRAQHITQIQKHTGPHSCQLPCICPVMSITRTGNKQPKSINNYRHHPKKKKCPKGKARRMFVGDGIIEITLCSDIHFLQICQLTLYMFLVISDLIVCPSRCLRS